VQKSRIRRNMSRGSSLGSSEMLTAMAEKPEKAQGA
jgi:hypothetical protein